MIAGALNVFACFTLCRIIDNQYFDGLGVLYVFEQGVYLYKGEQEQSPPVVRTVTQQSVVDILFEAVIALLHKSRQLLIHNQHIDKVQHNHMNPNALFFTEVALLEDTLDIQKPESLIDGVLQVVVDDTEYLRFYLHDLLPLYYR